MKTLTCRYCDQPIYEQSPTEASPYNWNRRSWLTHSSDPSPTWESDAGRTCSVGGRAPLPKEICYYQKTNGEGHCSNPVSHEDVESGDFACGVHMKKFQEDLARERATIERKLKEKEEEEIAAWELSIYQEAYDRLAAVDPELFPPVARPEMARWRIRHFERDLSVDIVKLERLVRELGEANAEG